MIERMIFLLELANEHDPVALELCLRDTAGWVGYSLIKQVEHNRIQLVKEDFYKRLPDAYEIALVAYYNKPVEFTDPKLYSSNSSYMHNMYRMMLK